MKQTELHIDSAKIKIPTKFSKNYETTRKLREKIFIKEQRICRNEVPFFIKCRNEHLNSEVKNIWINFCISWINVTTKFSATILTSQFVIGCGSSSGKSVSECVSAAQILYRPILFFLATLWKVKKDNLSCGKSDHDRVSSKVFCK